MSLHNNPSLHPETDSVKRLFTFPFTSFLIFILIAAFSPVTGRCQLNGFGNGTSNVIVNTTQTINSYAKIQSSTANSITLSATSSFSPAIGNILLLINMQSGYYEIGQVAGVTGLTINFNTPLNNLPQYNTNSQAVLLPQYGNLTVANGGNIICPEWNGEIGGVIGFMVANTLTLSGGQINASGKGFIGGIGGVSGIGGLGGNGAYTSSNPSPNGGNSGEGGSSILGVGNPGYGGDVGASGTNGTNGTNANFGVTGINLPCGASVPACNASPNPGGRLYMGDGGKGGNGGNGKAGAGGGGSLSQCYPGLNGGSGGSGGNGGNGGRGGGIIYMRAQNVVHTGTQISVSGLTGTSGTSGTAGGNGGNGNCGGGGGNGADGGDGGAGGNGGAGGAVKVVKVTGTINTGLLNLSGGNGGISGTGGAGGLGGLNSSEDSCICSPFSGIPVCMELCYFDSIMKYIMSPNTTPSIVNGITTFTYISNDTILNLTYSDLGATNCPAGFLGKLSGNLLVDSLPVCFYSTLIYSPNNTILSCLNMLNANGSLAQVFPDSIVINGCVLTNGCYTCPQPVIIEQPENGDPGLTPTSNPGGPGYFEEELGCVPPVINSGYFGDFCECAFIPLTGTIPPGTIITTSEGFISNNALFLCNYGGCMPSYHTVTVNPTINGCGGLPATIIFSTSPGVSAYAPSTVCSGETVDIFPSCMSFLTQISGPNIGFSGGNSFIAINTGNTPVTATFVVGNMFWNNCNNLFSITVLPAVAGEVTNTTACDSYTWNGQTYSSSGAYQHTSFNPNGCQEIDSLYLVILSSTSTTSSLTTCGSTIWNGQTLTATGTYTNVSLNASGCTHTEVLNLTVNPSTVNVTQLTACDSLNWNGQTYYSSGLFSQNTLDPAGCNLIDSLYLTIYPSTYSFSTLTSCLGTTWNNQTLSSTGMYTSVSTNAMGCPQYETLMFTMLEESYSTSNHEACGSYTWHGNTYYQSGTYFQTLTNQVGCDSNVTLQLTIHPVSVKIDTVFSCNVNTPQADTTYLTNQNGCDSLIIVVTAPAPLELYPSAGFQLLPGLLIFPDIESNVVNFSNENLQHEWFFNGQFIGNGTDNFAISAPDIGSYDLTLIVTNSLNCTDTLTQYLQVVPELLLHVPNTFTPNGDEFNHVFLPVFSEPEHVTNYQLLIFNRWAQPIFESRSQYVGWDGNFKDQPVGNDNYTWMITYTSILTNERKEVIGHVNVVR